MTKASNATQKKESIKWRRTKGQPTTLHRELMEIKVT